MYLVDPKKNVQFLPEKNIIKSSEFAALVKASGILKAAKDESKSTVDAANVEAGRILEESKQAYEDERERGYKDGLEQGKQEMAEEMMDLVAKSAESFNRFQENVIGIVTRAVRRVIGEINATERIQKIVENALLIIRNEKQATLRVHPSQAAEVRKTVDSFVKGNEATGLIEVVADPRLPEDSCVLETEVGVIDASLETQLKAIEKSIQKTLS